jgi:uncharacterized short protein YbdD (DUF466 family)
MYGNTPYSGPGAFVRQVLAVVRRIVGVPDYDAYLQHMRTHHPDAEPVTKEVFTKECMEAKYSRPGHRCC